MEGQEVVAGAASLEVHNLSKTFAGNPALAAFSLTIERGEIHALLGENGSGKSTFIKLLSGFHQPDRGATVTVAGRTLEFGSPASSYALGVRVVHQDLGLINACSVADNLSINTGFACRWGTIRSREELKRANADLARVGADINPSALVETLSPAQRTEVAVARTLRPDEDAPARLLVLDEPTATMPIAEVQQLLAMVRRLASQGIGVLYVTHRLDEVFEVANQVTVIRDGRKVATNPIESLDRRGLVQLLVGDEYNDLAVPQGSLQHVTGPPVLRVESLTAGPLNDVRFFVAPGEIVGFAGITGSGRESLLPSIFGAISREAGTVTVGDIVIKPLRPDAAISNGMAYLPPDRKAQGGIMDLTARENLSLADLKPFWKSFRLKRGMEHAEVRSWFDLLNVRPSNGLEFQLSTFSGGNQQKILFAKWLRRKPRVLLLDEPTQGVDVQTKASLHRQLVSVAAEGAAVVVSSADLDELATLCHRVIVLRGGRIVSSLAGETLSVPSMTQGVLGSS